MKHIDENIREIFSQKLGELESPVSPELWNAVSAQIAQPAAAAGTAVAAKVISAKLLWAAAVAVITAGSIGAYVLLAKDRTATEQVKPVTGTSAPQTITALPLTDAAPLEADIEKPTVERANGTNDQTRPDQAASTRVTRTESRVLNNNNVETAAIEPQPSKEQGMKEIPGVVESAASDVSGNAAVVSSSDESVVFTAAFSVTEVAKGELRYFFIPEGVDAKSYEWDLGDGTVSSEMSPFHQYDEEGDYTVTLKVTNAQGTVKPLTKVVKAMRPSRIMVPDIFTPNGDGLNDTFDVAEKSLNINITKVLVYDRSGQLVFESADGASMWDGNDRFGNACPVATYNFVVNGIDVRNHQIKETSGTVTLKR